MTRTELLTITAAILSTGATKPDAATAVNDAAEILTAAQALTVDTPDVDVLLVVPIGNRQNAADAVDTVLTLRRTTEQAAAEASAE